MFNSGAHVFWYDWLPGLAHSNQFKIVLRGEFPDAAQQLVSTSMRAAIAVGALGCVAISMRRAIAD
ncbi:hypothetical protein [Rubrivivax gelatinosus]|uniref:hypothetical protein n=1 Tax=Rubrivivax gelatinosus TaxID=28068 RepID=UPI001902E427|nr:hypothetical protein [Rubrivivax gelatinosus]